MERDEAVLNEYLGEIQKSQHGNTLAMGAIAEGLSKMNSWMDKQASKEEELQRAQAMEKESQETSLAKQSLIKEITTGVLSALQKENMELNADKFHAVKHKDVFYAEGGDEDKQVDVKLRNDTKEVQRPIQAMLKQLIALNKHFLKEHADLYENENGDENAKEEVMGGEEEEVEMAYPAANQGEEEHPMDASMGEEEEGAAEFPMEEDEWKDKDMYKMIKSLRKEITTLKKSFDSRVEKEATKLADKTLSKQGWNKEISRQPRLIKNKTMGLDENPIVKSQDNKDAVDQLASLSWHQITAMRAKRDAGDVAGLPTEVLGGR